MSLIRGVTTGVVIAALYIAAGHLSFEYRSYSFSGSAEFAVAVLSVLVPLAIVWGWTWVSDRWSGRSGPRLLLYTVGLALATAAGLPVEAALFPSPDATFVGAVSIHAVDGVLLVLPVIAIAAVLYWAFGSGRLPLALPTLALGYLISLPLGLLFPPAAMGTVAGTAAGHAWRAPGARTLIATLVVMTMLVAAVELPLAAATADGARFLRSLLP